MSRDWSTTVKYVLVVLLVGAVYWPVRHAQFVWDDLILFHDVAVLREGDSWMKFLVNGLTGYVNYFRPLAAAVFSLQLHAFDTQPEPMHLVSLTLHLINTSLVYVLARRFANGGSSWILAMCALFYGMHPALTESVVWISCQNELEVTALSLLAFWANVSITSAPWRAVTVGLAFFLAACAKESAIAVPLLIATYDVFVRVRGGQIPWKDATRDTWRAQRGVYAALVAAGVLYIVLRNSALGTVLVSTPGTSLISVPHWQKVSFTLMNYIRLAVWPMAGLYPLHEVDGAYFQSFAPSLIAQDAAAITVIAAGAVLFWRGHPLGALIVSFVASLFAVLNVIPVPFVESVYHERYLTLPLAMVAIWLSMLLRDFRTHRRWLRIAILCGALTWMAAAAANVRSIIPLWSDERTLWQWAAQQNPNSVIVRDHLLSMYIAQEDYAHARPLARRLFEENPPCQSCAINAAFLALHDGDEATAAAALQRLESKPGMAADPSLFHDYILATGELRELRKDWSGAEDAYRDAISVEPGDPDAAMQLAALLMSRGRLEEGKIIGEQALILYAPDERERHRKVLEAVYRDSEGAAKRTKP